MRGIPTPPRSRNINMMSGEAGVPLAAVCTTPATAWICSAGHQPQSRNRLLLEIILHLKHNYKRVMKNSVRKFPLAFTTPCLKIDDL